MNAIDFRLPFFALILLRTARTQTDIPAGFTVALTAFGATALLAAALAVPLFRAERAR
ncbi:MAG: hypothetical protein JF597_39380 [Streptomyces sp.]|uniref:hypothetical protein n=1 Tax=Streptomyces sp. TaxID=1931 RepID=UPI0025E86E43|nr:hypothetical protein [Streptomyces sp.]MBW8799424.1 hypothetical protein [Streptomyces sp.]